MSMLFKRIKDWAVSITSFRNGDVMPVDGPKGTAKMSYSDLAKEVIKDSANNTAATEADLVAGSKLPIITANGPKALPGNVIAKASEQTALTTYAQNVAHSIASEFDPTRDSEHAYPAGYSVTYTDGKTYTFTAPHYGAWTGTDVYLGGSDIANKVIPFMTENFKVKDYNVQDGTSSLLRFNYTPTEKDSNYFILRKNKYGTETTFGLFAFKSSDSSSSVIKYGIPFDEIFEAKLPNGYDQFIFYNNEYVSSGIDVELFNANLAYLPKRLDDVEKLANDELVAEKKAYEYVVNAETSGRLQFYFEPVGTGDFILYKENYSNVNDYTIYETDTTGVNAQRTYMSGVRFGEIVHLEHTEGYNNYVFFKNEYVTTGIKLVLNEVFTDSMAWNVKKQSEASRELIAFENVRHFVKNAGVSDRLNFSVTPSKNSEKYLLKINDYVGATDYRIYLKDSSGVNSQKLIRSGIEFGKIVKVSLQTGYDQFMFFVGATTTNKIDVDLLEVFDTLAGRVQIDEQNFYPLKGRKVVCFGDSITQFNNDGMRYSDYFQEISGSIVTNVGIGGSRYSLRTPVVETPTSANQARAALDMYNLVHCWCTDSWASVDNAVQYLIDHATAANYSSIIAGLKSISISEAEYVTLFAGTNDYAFGIPLGSLDNGDVSTVLGALGKIIEELLTTNPKLHIFIFSPVIRWFGEGRLPENFSDVYVASGYVTSGVSITLKDFAATICESGKNLHIPTCDLYNTLGWTKWNYSAYFPNNDDTHPLYGFKNLGIKFNSFICSNLSS